MGIAAPGWMPGFAKDQSPILRAVLLICLTVWEQIAKYRSGGVYDL